MTLFPLFPHLFPMKWWDRMPWSSFSECWALSQLFHSPVSLSLSGNSLDSHTLFILYLKFCGFLPNSPYFPHIVLAKHFVSVSMSLDFYLDSIKVRPWSICLSLYGSFISIMLSRSCDIVSDKTIPSHGWIIFHYIYIFFSFMHCWALMLFPCFSYCEQYWNECEGEDIFPISWYAVSFPLTIYS